MQLPRHRHDLDGHDDRLGDGGLRTRPYSTEAEAVELRFGTAETLWPLIDVIARRQGLGDLLAEGSARPRAAARPRQRSLRRSRQGPRSRHARPAPHGEHAEELPGLPTGGDHTGSAYEERAFRNVIGLCHFLNYSQEQVVALTRAITGWDDFDADEARRSWHGARPPWRGW